MARYFIVEPTPLRMRPGLFKLGQDFGNGAQDSLFFQRDEAYAEYRAEKERVLAEHPGRLAWLTDDRAIGAIKSVGDWMCQELAREVGESLEIAPRLAAPNWATRAAWHDLSIAIQEDFAVLQLDENGQDRLVLLSVAFPSGWRPEVLLGRTFSHVHEPVVEFEEVAKRSQQLVSAMVDKGPYVRFVWTVTADARLDHHPVEAPRDVWSEASVGYLRVERQLTVPFGEQRASLFLIRTYLYPFSALSAPERATLKSAVQQLSPAILEYKGMTRGLPLILNKLELE